MLKKIEKVKDFSFIRKGPYYRDIFNQLTDTKSLFFKNSCLKSARFLKVFYLLDLFLRLFFN